MPVPSLIRPIVATTLACCAVLAATATAQAPVPGEKWKVTMGMEMMGMSMPGMTQEVCTPKGAQDAPMNDNKDCVYSNRRRSGNTESVDMVCTGKMNMSGTMAITRDGPDRYRGKMVVNMEGQQMTMNYTSERLGGACDAKALERKVNEIQANISQQTQKSCAESAKAGALVPTMFVGAGAMCTDAATRAQYCASAQTYKGFGQLSSAARLASTPGIGKAEADAYRGNLADSAKLCGFTVDAVRSKLCAGAQGGEWAFFAAECPAAKTLAARECAGRDFTNPVAAKYRDFCSAYASASRGMGAGPSANPTSMANSPAASAATPVGSGDPAQQPEGTGSKTKDALKKGKDALKGLFGR
jgi:hypothetical protein